MNIRVALLSAILAVVAGVLVPSPAAGQMATFDHANFLQSIQQVKHMVTSLQRMQDQLSTMRGQLAQAQQQYQAITGSRGMGNLVTDQARDYIPRNWRETLAANQSGEFGRLVGEIRESAGYLADANLEGINDAYRASLQQTGERAITNQAAHAAVFEESSARFERIQTLMDHIETAEDDKAVQDLQARIQVEQVMLQNELIRAQSMASMMQAQERVEREASKQRAAAQRFDYSE